MEIKQVENEQKGDFRILVGDEIAALMSYSKAGNQLIIIDHTEVEEGFTGKGYGFFLLEKMVEYARRKEVKILPLCPFANASMQKHPEFHDVLKS